MINLDAYREQLNRSIAQATGQTYMPTDTSDQGSTSQDNLGAVDNPDDSGGMATDAGASGGMASASPTTPQVPQNLGASQADPAQAQQQSQQQDAPRNIDIGPPAVKPEFDEDKLKDAKTLADHVDAMTPAYRKAYLNWYEGQYGRIQDHYDEMLKQIGEKPDPDRQLSRKDMWTALMNFGVSMIKNSSNPNNTLAGSISQSVGDTVQGINQGRQQEQQQYASGLQAANDARNDQMKNLGTYGQALKGQSEMDANQTRADAERNKPSQVKSVEDTDQGLVAVSNNGRVTPLTNPRNGKQLKDNPSSPRAGGQTTYSQERDDLIKMYRGMGMPQSKAEVEAIKSMHDKTGKKPPSNIELRDRAEKYAKQTLGSPKDWRPSRNGGKTYQQAMDQQVDRNYQLLRGINGDSNTEDAGKPVVPPANRPPLQSFHR